MDLRRATSVEQALAWRLENPGSRLLGGGTDLIVNIRRGIGDDPGALIDVNGIAEMNAIEGDGSSLRIGAAVKLAALAAHPLIRDHTPVLAQAAGSIAGATQRNMGTLGGNLCLDTRCIFYNQSEWWRASNDYCLKYGGTKCHVAPKSTTCFATFSGDLAPALLVLGAEVEIAGRGGRRSLPLAGLYTRDGRDYLSLGAEEIVCSVTLRAPPGLRSGYDKIRVRRSIEFPLAGVAVALRREGDRLTDLRVAITGHQSLASAARGHGRPLRRGARRGRLGMFRRLGLASGHGDEDHVHARPLPPPRRRCPGPAPDAAVVR